MPDDVVRVKGFPELAAGTTKLAADIGRAADGQFARVASSVASTIAARVPRQSGRLAGSATAVPGSPAAVGLGGGVPYAGWIEFGGTRGRPYVPDGRYVFPSAQDAEPLLILAATAVANDQIKGMTWQTPK